MSVVLDTPVAVRRTAMDLLARREHGRVELTRKLRQRGATDELIEPELDRSPKRGCSVKPAISRVSFDTVPMPAMAPRAFARSWASVA